MDIDLENGGGGGNNGAAAAAAAEVVSMSPVPADPARRELQPSTWLRAAPFTVAALASFALLVAGLLLGGSSCAQGGGRMMVKCALGFLLAFAGPIAGLASLLAWKATNWACCLPRLN